MEEINKRGCQIKLNKKNTVKSKRKKTIKIANLGIVEKNIVTIKGEPS